MRDRQDEKRWHTQTHIKTTLLINGNNIFQKRIAFVAIGFIVAIFMFIWILCFDFCVIYVTFFLMGRRKTT